jgi:hypothetical protein
MPSRSEAITRGGRRQPWSNGVAGMIVNAGMFDDASGIAA